MFNNYYYKRFLLSNIKYNIMHNWTAKLQSFHYLHDLNKSYRNFSLPSVRRAIAIIDDNDQNRWNWHVSLKASGPPRPAEQVSRCQLMSLLPGTPQDSRTLCGTVSKESSAEEQKEEFLRLLWFCRAIPGRQP